MSTSVEEEKEEEENTEHRQSTPTPNTSAETMEARFEFSSPIQIGRGRRKLIRTDLQRPRTKQLEITCEKMTKEQQEQALETKTSDPKNTTKVENNGNNSHNKKYRNRTSGK